MAAKNLNKSKLKTNTSTRKSTPTSATLQSPSTPGETSAEKTHAENRKIHRRLYDWGYNAYTQSYKRLQTLQSSTHVLPADTPPETPKLGRVTKAKALPPVPAFAFNLSLFQYYLINIDNTSEAQ